MTSGALFAGHVALHRRSDLADNRRRGHFHQRRDLQYITAKRQPEQLARHQPRPRRRAGSAAGALTRRPLLRRRAPAQAAAACLAGRAAPASFSCWRSGEIRTTLCARPIFSSDQMTIAEMSTS